MTHDDVMQLIQQFVREKELKPGARLPSGRAMEELWLVSRLTINRAVACLVAQGALRREGYKLFVAAPVDAVEERPLCHILTIGGGERAFGELDFPGLLRGASEVAAANNMRLLPIYGPDQPREIQRLITDGTAGFVLWAERKLVDVLPAALRLAAERNIPFVVCDIDIGKFNFVGTDNERGMEAGIKHLLGLGHRRLAYITDTLKNSSIECRRSGFQQACLRYGLGRSYKRIFDVAAGDAAALGAALQTLRAEKHPTTGVLFSNITLADPFRELCLSSGLRVPEDISLIAFDEEPGGKHIFTTLAQDMYQIGVIAVQRLRQALREGQSAQAAPRIVRIRVEPTLIVGQSTAAPHHQRSTINDQ